MAYAAARGVRRDSFSPLCIPLPEGTIPVSPITPGGEGSKNPHPFVHMGYFLVQWFCSSSLAQRQLNMVLAKLGPSMTQLSTLVGRIMHLFPPTPVVSYL